MNNRLRVTTAEGSIPDGVAVFLALIVWPVETGVRACYYQQRVYRCLLPAQTGKNDQLRQNDLAFYTLLVILPLFNGLFGRDKSHRQPVILPWIKSQTLSGHIAISNY